MVYKNYQIKKTKKYEVYIVIMQLYSNKYLYLQINRKNVISRVLVYYK